MKALLDTAAALPGVKAAVHKLSEKSSDTTPLFLQNLSGSARSICLGTLFKQSGRTFILIHDDADQAAYLYHDLVQLFDEERVLMLPASFRHSTRYGGDDEGNLILRTEVLGALSALKNGAGKPHIIVASPESLLEKVVASDELDGKTIHLRQGEKIDTGFLSELLTEYGFQCVDYVYEPGQYAIRGSLTDIFSWSFEKPYRVDFFGDEVESIRSFDVETQLSGDRFDEIEIIPEKQQFDPEAAVPVSDYFPADAVVGFFDYDFCRHRLGMLRRETLEAEVRSLSDDEVGIRKSRTLPSGQTVDADAFFEGFEERFRCLEFGLQCHFSRQTLIPFQTAPQDSFGKNFDLAAQRLAEYQSMGYRLYFLSGNPRQTERFRAILNERSALFEGQEPALTPIDGTLHEGFIDRELKLLCYTDHQFFDRFHKYSLRSDRARSGKMALSLKELMQFQFGDYVVHVDHGIGRFGGLFKTTVNGREQEVMKILYKDNDVILVSIHNLHRVSKYRGKEGEEPVIHKLSSGSWEKIKERSKKKIKDIARDLVKVYAARLKEEGFAFSPDSYLQEALEASFIYEETPDQIKAIQAVKQDMESRKPMDRLVCGDVGFGKTEIAVRAAFKAVADGKQVAVLVPTTVLALQHYNTLSERLRDLPCSVDYLSRTRSAVDVRALLEGLKEGKPDILVGTHKLIGKSVKFKDLGLLIIDEEQKFGVSVKEKLRQLKTQVDTLTLTATPIPRTLQFSLMGARDLSVLSTPPANRYPIQTELYTFDREIIRDGIERELERNGQVFFVNSRISDLPDIEALIHSVVPQARTVIAHGQMEGDKLEEIIVDFINYEYDVLICTSIIENGIDIPNANTIFINTAQKFGLSDLHQLRGRVGRSNKKAFCYLLAPPAEYLTPEAKRRLQAIESFTELGSGMNIAMQDLDIRGAGNMLGAEQSGFIADLGFETYQRILKEAMQELRDEECPTLDDWTARTAQGADAQAPDEHPNRVYALEGDMNSMGASVDTWGAYRAATGGDFVADCQMESDLSLFFDESYIPGSPERMSLYREMDQLETEEAINAFENRLVDRFGPVPQEGKDLLQFIRLRLTAKKLGMEKIVLKNRQLIAYFVSNLNSPFYQSDVFGRIINYVNKHSLTSRLREVQGKRSLVLTQIDELGNACQALREMLQQPL